MNKRGKRRGALAYIYTRDRERLERLGERESRNWKDQLSLAVDEYCDHRGLDRETQQPVPRSSRKKQPA